MRLRDEIKDTLGIEVDEDKVRERLGGVIANPKTPEPTAYGFSKVLFLLGIDQMEFVNKRYGEEKAMEIMDDHQEADLFDEELQANFLYVACVWGELAKEKTQEHPYREAVARVIDQIVLTCVKYWTIQPLFDQSSVPGEGQRRVSRIMAYLVKQGVLGLVKQSKGKGQVNTYELIGTKDIPYEELKQKFEALRNPEQDKDDDWIVPYSELDSKERRDHERSFKEDSLPGETVEEYGERKYREAPVFDW